MSLPVFLIWRVSLHPCRPGVVNALEDFKYSVFGIDYAAAEKATETTKKRKAPADNATKEYTSYDWCDLAENGKVKAYFICHFPSTSLVSSC